MFGQQRETFLKTDKRGDVFLRNKTQSTQTFKDVNKEKKST